MEITITQFKAKCLKIVEDVQLGKGKVVISRHGRPAAVLTAVDRESSAPLFGRAAGSVSIQGDILSTGEVWNAGD